MKFVVVVCVVLHAPGLIHAQAPVMLAPPVYAAPVMVQPPVYAPPAMLAPPVYGYPYVQRIRYWTPLRDFFFGTHRIRYAPYVAPFPTR